MAPVGEIAAVTSLFLPTLQAIEASPIPTFQPPTASLYLALCSSYFLPSCLSSLPLSFCTFLFPRWPFPSRNVFFLFVFVWRWLLIYIRTLDAVLKQHLKTASDGLGGSLADYSLIIFPFFFIHMDFGRNISTTDNYTCIPSRKRLAANLANEWIEKRMLMQYQVFC